MDFLFDLGLFGGKVFLLAFAVAALLVVFFALLARARGSKPAIKIESLNRRFDTLEQALRRGVLAPKAYKSEEKALRKQRKKDAPARGERPRLFVLDFEGDVRASHVDNLREEITAVLTVARPGVDEVLLRVESPGGMVHGYGLAASQMMRVRDAKLKLTVAVDKVAASGGYMMACTAEQILAAPFAIIGSIGVVAQIPNFHRLLKKHDVDFEEITAGEFKRTISLFGEITEKGRQKFLDQIEDTHGLFKQFVNANRPRLDLERVATGEYWFGTRALDLGLVDRIVTSDEYIFARRSEANVFRVSVTVPKKWSEKLAESVARLIFSGAEHLGLQSVSTASVPRSPLNR